MDMEFYCNRQSFQIEENKLQGLSTDFFQSVCVCVRVYANIFFFVT